MMRSSFLIAILCCPFSTCLVGQEPAPGTQVEQVFESSDGGKVPYLLYLPKDYRADGEPSPLIFFLHGRGESDGPLSLVAKWGPPHMAARGDELPFVILSPQCPTDDSWSSDTQQARLNELLDAVIATHSINTSRIYLTGLSMGGSGSWRMAADHPKRFAAVVPICGRGDTENASVLKQLPIWVFVGDQDRVFSANVEIVEAITLAGSSSIRLTTLEHIGHNAWSAAYATPDLYQWLLSHESVQP